MVFEPLRMSLYDFLKKNNYKGNDDFFLHKPTDSPSLKTYCRIFYGAYSVICQTDIDFCRVHAFNWPDTYRPKSKAIILHIESLIFLV